MVENNRVENLLMIPAYTRLDEALERDKKNESTDKYSFGDPIIDAYMGGGWGRHDAYEVICVFGGTGMNKSTLVSQMVISPAAKGDRVAYLALEDELEDVLIRMYRQLEPTGLIAQKKLDTVLRNIDFFPENSGYSLSALLEVIEDLLKTYAVVVIDPIQFAFEASIVDKGDTEWNRQRIFIQKLIAITKKAKKPVIFVSHTNKTIYNNRGGGALDANAALGATQGSGSLPQGATKAVFINRDSNGIRTLSLAKTRFTQNRYVPLQISFDPKSLRIGFDKTGLTQTQINQCIEGA